MAYFSDPAQIKIINFIPVRMVGNQQFARRSLGALDGYEGDRPTTGIPLDLRFRGSGVTSANVGPVLAAIRAAVLATRHFETPSYLGWGTDGTLVYRGEVRSSNYTLGQILGFMQRLASEVTQQTGKQVRVVRVSYTNVPSRFVEPAGDSPGGSPAAAPPPSGEGLMSRVPPPEELMSVPPSLTLPPAPQSQTVTVRELQQRLNAAGHRPRLSTDGRWGTNTQRALEAFAAAQGVTLPALDSGSSYRKVSATEVVVPGALWAKLPAPTGGQSSPPRRPSPAVVEDEPSEGTPPPPSDEQDRDSSGARPVGGGVPWMWIGVAAACAVAVGLFLANEENSPTRG